MNSFVIGSELFEITNYYPVSALVGDGVQLEALDKSMKTFGTPVGPVTLADKVDINVTHKVASFLSQTGGGGVSLMENMIEKGWLGSKKSGQGFYLRGKKKTINDEVKAYVRDFTQQDERKRISKIELYLGFRMR